MSIVPPKDGFFPIASVHRDDLVEKGFDVSNVTDKQMERLAEKMGSLYLEFGGFWDHLEEIAEEMGIPRRADYNRLCVEDQDE